MTGQYPRLRARTRRRKNGEYWRIEVRDVL